MKFRCGGGALFPPKVYYEHLVIRTNGPKMHCGQAQKKSRKKCRVPRPTCRSAEAVPWLGPYRADHEAHANLRGMRALPQSCHGSLLSDSPSSTPRRRETPRSSLRVKPEPETRSNSLVLPSERVCRTFFLTLQAQPECGGCPVRVPESNVAHRG